MSGTVQQHSSGTWFNNILSFFRPRQAVHREAERQTNILCLSRNFKHDLQCVLQLYIYRLIPDLTLSTYHNHYIKRVHQQCISKINLEKH